MTEPEIHDRVLAQMHARLGAIERRLDGLEPRLWWVGGLLGLLMSVYKFL